MPLRRLGTEAEVSAAICFLLSEGAAYISGVTLPIDGAAPLRNALMDMGAYDPAPEFQGFHRAKTPEILKKDDE